MNNIEENTALCLEKVRAAAAACERTDDITVLAATKTRNKSEIQTVISCGIADVGENRVQEFIAKYDEGAYNGARTHFIGQLQSNKVKYIVGKVCLIHSLDSINTALEIEKYASGLGIVQDALIEINIGEEAVKGGVNAAEAVKFIKSIASFPHIKIRGIMCIPPAGEPPVPYFEKARALYLSLRSEYGCDILSMGMSGDFEEAITFGATIIRLGTALFGERNRI